MSALDLIARRLLDSGFGSQRMPWKARSANAPLGVNDNGGWFDLTGTFTQTFQGVSAIGPDASFILRNAGTGDITLDPNGSETIDGLTSFVMYPGEARLVQCDGTALRSIVLQGFRKTFTQSDNFIKPPCYAEFGGILRSGGAAGVFNSNTAQRAEGGTGGGAFPFSIPATALPASTAVTIGNGGAGSTSDGATPNPGGNSSFGGITVAGGGNGQGGTAHGGSVNGAIASQTKYATGFEPSGVNIDDAVSPYGGGSRNAGGGITQQGSSVFGGGCGGLVVNSSNALLTPGSSTFAGRGGNGRTIGTASANQSDGVIPSGGGGGSRVSPSGAGARGQLDIWGIV